jgi:hypothetical protein
MTSDNVWTEIRTAADVTPEILDLAEHIEAGWWSGDARIDWGEFVDRMDGARLKDGTRLDVGADLDSPAIRKIKKHIRDLRKAG